MKIGDKVYVYSATSMGSSSEGEYEIIKIDSRYDEHTGEKYDRIHVGCDLIFDARDGNDINSSVFYIDI